MPLSVSSGASAWIDDFVNSTDPRFEGKSKEKRKQMALGAFYSAKRKKENMALLANAQYLLELDNTPNQDKRNLDDPSNPYTSNRTTPPSSRYVSGGMPPQAQGMAAGASSSLGVSSSGVPAQQPSMDTGGGLNPTTTAVPSSMASRSGDLLGAQGNLATPATDLNTSSTYNSGTPKELGDLSKTKTPKSDSLLLVSPRQLLESGGNNGRVG